MKFLVIVGLVLGVAAGCDASGDSPGFGSGTGGEQVNQRGDVDAGGAGGSSGGGAGGSAGAGASQAGGRNGAGGAVAAAGGSAGATGGTGGSGAGGAGGGGVAYVSCDVYSWTPSTGGGCTKQITAGVFLTGYKDGHKCGVCGSPARSAGVPECYFPGTPALCVLSCDECTFQ